MKKHKKINGQCTCIVFEKHFCLNIDEFKLNFQVECQKSLGVTYPAYQKFHAIHIMSDNSRKISFMK